MNPSAEDLERAKKIVYSFHLLKFTEQDGGIEQLTFFAQSAQTTIAQALASVRAEEREACAQAAENRFYVTGSGGIRVSDFEQTVGYASDEIAKAIRERGLKGEFK